MMEFRKFMALLTAFSFLIMVINPPLYAQTEKPKFIAVLDLDIAKAIPAEARVSLSDLLREKLVNTGRFRVVDRNNMDKILKEQGFQLQDCTSKECAVQVGRLLGVEKMVSGNVTKLGQTYIISAQMTNVETGEIEQMSSDRCGGCEVDQLLDTIENVANKLAGVQVEAAERAPAPKPKVPETGKLSVTSRPDKAKILINGTDQGTTPNTISGLKPGSYEVRIQKQGFMEYVQKVTVDPGASMSVDTSLVAAQAVSVERQRASVSKAPAEEQETAAAQAGHEKKGLGAGWIVLIVLASVAVVGGGSFLAYKLASGGGSTRDSGTTTVTITGPLP
ncbi:MAG: PEGA domain-containing protein [bacterium]|nr:PEGA domain-containing protein [bacterium]